MTIPFPVGVNGQPVNMNAADSTYSSTVTVLPGSAINSQSSETALVNALAGVITERRVMLQLKDAYYRGEQQINDLGISVPPSLKWLKVPLGWPRVCVDAVDERLRVMSFRCGAEGAEQDMGLSDIWAANDLDSQQSPIHIDAMVFGQAYVSVGANPRPGGLPVVSMESPLDMAVQWDPRTRQIGAALRIYGGEMGRQATLYRPNETVYLSRLPGSGEWVVDDRDEHGLGVVPVVRFVNRPRSYDLNGTSDITPELMAVTDDASRTLQSMAVAREYYSAPQRYILGAKESDFVDASGNPKSAVELYLGRFLALENDEMGNRPQVGQFAAYDPTAFTKIIDTYSRVVSSITGLPSHVLGFSTDNPASADAIRASDHRIETRAQRKTELFGSAWCEVMRLALMFRDGGDLMPEANQMQAVWADTGTPTPMATAQEVTMIANAGIVPKSSRVLLDRLAFTATEQELISEDRKRDYGENFLEQLGTDVQADEFRKVGNIIKMKNEMEAPSGNSTGSPDSA